MNLPGIFPENNVYRKFHPENGDSLGLQDKQKNYFSRDNSDQNNINKSKQRRKNIIDCITVALGLFVASLPLLGHIRAGKLGKIASQTENFEKKTKILLNQVESINKQQVGLPFISKFGMFWEKLSQRKELTNNLIYTLGALLIEPLVILFSPFGKDKSKKEDKIAAVLRQPISVIATFGLQCSIDKFLNGLVPKLSRYGFLGEEFKSKLKDFADLPIKNRIKVRALQEKSVIILNLIALPLSCMLQNVLYGKFMKYYYSLHKKESKKL